MTNMMIDYLKAKLIIDAGNVNHYADENDTNRNHVNYGAVISYADVLRRFGVNDIDIPDYEDEGCLRIPKIVIGTRTIQFEH